MATTTTNTTPASSVTEDEEDNNLPELKDNSKESAVSGEAEAASKSLIGKYINSTYLIDQSKKALLGYCFFPTNNTVPSSLRGMNVSLAGNISPKVLSKITIGFKENFEEGEDVVKKDFDKLMKPVNTLLSGLVARIPVLNKLNLNIGGNSGLRETGIMAYALFGGLMEMSGFPEIKTNIGDFDKIYYYNVPIRKAPPALSMGLGSDFEIEFRYGSCNVFDAYWEVYYPLMRLKNTLFPSLSLTGNGLGTMSGVKAPYPQEAFVTLLKNVFTLGSSPTGIIGATKELGKIQAMFDANDSLEEKAQKQIEKWRNKGPSVKDKKAIKFQKKIEDKLKKYAAFRSIPGAEEIINDYKDVEDDENPDPVKIGDILGDILDKYYEDTTKTKDISKFKVNSITASNPQFLEEKKKEDTSESENNYGDIIKSIINFEPTMIGQTLAELYGNYVSGSCKQIYFAFPSKYVTSLVDLYEINSTTGAGGKAYLSLQNIIFEDVDVSFDFSNVDERGYPMAGSLHIKAMWPVTGPSSALSFRNPSRTTDNMKENISEF